MSCLRDQKWELFPLELYISGNMARLGQFASSLPPSEFLTPPPFRSPFLGAPRGLAVTEILLYPRGTTGSPRFFTPAMDSSVTIHGTHRESLSQLCYGFRIQLRVNGSPVFVRITGSSRFTCSQGLYVFFWIQSFVILHT